MNADLEKMSRLSDILYDQLKNTQLDKDTQIAALGDCMTRLCIDVKASTQEQWLYLHSLLRLFKSYKKRTTNGQGY